MAFRESALAYWLTFGLRPTVTASLVVVRAKERWVGVVRVVEIEVKIKGAIEAAAADRRSAVNRPAPAD